MSIKAKIRSAQDLDREVIAVPEWDVSIEVRSMTVRQRASFVAASQDTSDNGDKIENVYGQILVTCCLDPEDGSPVFNEDDLSWLMTEKSGAVIDRLVTSCLEVSGLKEKAIDEAGKSYSASPTVSDVGNLNEDRTSI
ncbi:hypothetical protein UFOVP665_47 [uncultured Caudovirales phage]|uniref:Tail assembly chaperone n=1 Tax=uncultured Caudovirales phage TaxID=2100421 RepID=A0A6J5NBD9_9CAUD|nr:hypothetical protein UFOVP665_47 [uncultured Caudovirales phage]